MSATLHLNDAQVKSLLYWDKLIAAIEHVMAEFSKKDETLVVQPPRLVMHLPMKEGFLLSMPGFSAADNTLACKLVTSFSRNNEKGLPNIFATVLLLDADTGKLKMIMEGGEITARRTAAASVVATKHLHCGKKKVLAVLGAGAQARCHILAFRHAFHFEQVRVWNHHFDHAQRLCAELGDGVKPYRNNKECVHDADIIVTATHSPEPVLQASWLKEGAHINAVGHRKEHKEIDVETYRAAQVFTDSMDAAATELRVLTDQGVEFAGELGDVINGKIVPHNHSKFTLYQSLGIALQDVVAANLVYQEYVARESRQ